MIEQFVFLGTLFFYGNDWLAIDGTLESSVVSGLAKQYDYVAKSSEIRQWLNMTLPTSDEGMAGVENATKGFGKTIELIHVLQESQPAVANLTSYLAAEATLTIVKDRLTPYVREEIQRHLRNISMDCKEHLTNYLISVISANFTDDPAALHMFDSTSKVVDGVMEECTMQHMSDYDDCINVHHNDYNYDGEFCLLHAKKQTPDLKNYLYPYYIAGGICVPSTCSEDDIRHLLDKRQLSHNNLTFRITVPERSCSTKKSFESRWDTKATIAFNLLLSLGIILLTCTVLDICLDRQGKNAASRNILIRSFSIKSSTEEIFRTSNEKRELNVLDGLRVVATLITVLSHNFSMFVLGHLINNRYFSQVCDSWLAVIPIVLSPTDILFFLSGALMSMEIAFSYRNGTYHPMRKIIQRYFRVAPTILAFLVIFLPLFPVIMSGSRMTDILDYSYYKCEDKFWKLMTLTSTLFNTDTADVCQTHFWGISTDMQLAVLAPIIAWIFIKFRRAGASFLFLCVVCSALTCALRMYIYDFTVFLTQMDVGYFNDFNKWWARIPTYVIGMLFGKIIADDLIAKKKRIFSKVQLTIAWTVSLGLFYLLIHLGKKFIRENGVRTYTRMDSATFMAVSKIVFPILIAWIAYATTHNYGGILGNFLSANIFRPIAKLSFGINLVHVNLQYFKMTQSKSPIVFDHYYHFTTLVPICITSIFCAYILQVSVTSPCYKISMHVLDKVWKPNKKLNSDDRKRK